MREVQADAKTIRQLLGGTKYAIDYYQREYKWQSKQIAELLDDLSDKFLESYDPLHDRGAVAEYGHYFLGSIIISDKEGRKYIIDGQQRLTSLTLLLIYLHRLLTDVEQKAQIADLIFSQKYGKRSFNLDVEERTAVMEALYNGQHIEENGQPESVGNILSRYRDIEDQFPMELGGEVLPFFVDWFIENVHMVEITAYSDDDAYAIFETMNDRGLALAPTDMLKGYLLANINDTQQRNRANILWKKRATELKEYGREEDADAIKSWLRSQFAESIRERKKGATPQDFDRIGTEFHRWVRDNNQRLGLDGKSKNFAAFIEHDFAFYSQWYYRLRRAAYEFTPGLEFVYYNAGVNFTLQYPVLLAPLCFDDSEAEALRKLGIVGAYLDILIARRIWNWRSIEYSTMQYAMFLVMRDIRRRSATEVAEVLSERLTAEQETFATNDRFSLTGGNRWRIHVMLARMTEYVERESGLPSRYTEYVGGRGKLRHEVEHIWANHPERHIDEFSGSDFQAYRNRIGALLLLPKAFNASYNDLPYFEKREHYLKQNLLAQSLHELAYERNPGFLAFVKRSQLPFRPHREFSKADLDERQFLYQRIAERVWDVARLGQHLQ